MSAKAEPFPSSARFVAPVALLCASLAFVPPAHALMVAVYGNADKATVEELRTLAREEKARNEKAASETDRSGAPLDAGDASGVRADGYVVKVSGTSVLTAEFSVPAGMSAYFLTDGGLAYEGFVMQGVSAHFVQSGADDPAPGDGLAKEALPVDAPPAKVYATALRDASLSRGGLRVGYSVSSPGRVEIEAVGVNGERLGKWSVAEAAPGEFRRVLPLARGAKGPVYVRWSHGDVRAVWKVSSALRE